MDPTNTYEETIKRLNNYDLLSTLATTKRELRKAQFDETTHWLTLSATILTNERNHRYHYDRNPDLHPNEAWPYRPAHQEAEDLREEAEIIANEGYYATRPPTTEELHEMYYAATGDQSDTPEWAIPYDYHYEPQDYEDPFGDQNEDIPF